MSDDVDIELKKSALTNEKEVSLSRILPLNVIILLKLLYRK